MCYIIIELDTGEVNHRIRSQIRSWYMKNAVVIINLKDDLSAPNKPYVDRCIYAWNFWANKYGADFIEINNPMVPMVEVPATFQRWNIFEYLRNAGLSYSQIAMVDFDTIPSPFCRNFLALTDNEFSAVPDGGEGNQLNRGIRMVKENWEKLSKIDTNWGNYFNAGFAVFNEKHEKAFKDVVDFYKNEKEKWMVCNKTKDFTDDQTILNFMVRYNGFKVNLLPRSFNVLAWHAWNFLTPTFTDYFGRTIDRKTSIKDSVDIFHLCGDVDFREKVSEYMLADFKEEYGL